MIEVPVKSVMRLASDAGLPESVIERHFDSLSEIILRAKMQERKKCINTMRGWFHAKERAPLHDLIESLEN